MFTPGNLTFKKHQPRKKVHNLTVSCDFFLIFGKMIAYLWEGKKKERGISKYEPQRKLAFSNSIFIQNNQTFKKY